jgi:hypothetical protein
VEERGSSEQASHSPTQEITGEEIQDMNQNTSQLANDPSRDVDDESENDDEVAPASFDVTSYGADPEVEGLVRKISRGDILIPTFQRDYVWRQAEASRFIESLLLGLPVPGVFFATDPESNKQLVIDGQQRLKSLQFFYNGYFNPKPDEKRQRVFSLVKVQERFEGKTYKTLDDRDRTRLDNAIIHATVVKQTLPAGDDTSMYHIFERLNSGGRRLSQQEIRIALYHGPLMALIVQLNEWEPWRAILGGASSGLKDQELILRFFALLIDEANYSRPMAEFLSRFAGKYRNAQGEFQDKMPSLFKLTVSQFYNALGRTAFRPGRAVNAAVFDSCMLGLARRLSRNDLPLPSVEKIVSAYNELLADKEYNEAISRSTADEKFVTRRIDKAVTAFSHV